MDENNGGPSVSLKKLEANRRNARRSTGPRSDGGKQRSRGNALRHGILTSALLITNCEIAEDRSEFAELLSAFNRELSPVGTLEEMLVEKIAICCWRQKRVLRCEAGLATRFSISALRNPFREEDGQNTDDLSLPLGPQLDQILRYETTIQRQLDRALDQLERLQRTRKGEHVPAPVTVQLSSDQ